MFCLCPLHSLDLFGTVVFAAGGALVAKDQQRTAPTALLYAILTAVGGGTLRDILLTQYPFFWMRSPIYIAIASTVGLLTFALASFHKRQIREIWLLGALSLAVFTVIGTQVALESPLLANSPFLGLMISPLMGLLTGVGGGFVRDVIGDKTPFVVLHPGYALASLAGGSIYSILAIVQAPALVCILLAIAVVFLLLPVPFQSLNLFIPSLSPLFSTTE